MSSFFFFLDFRVCKAKLSNINHADRAKLNFICTQGALKFYNFLNNNREARSNSFS